MPLPVVATGFYCQIRMSLHSTQFAECTVAVTRATGSAEDVATTVGQAWDINVMDVLSQDVRHLDTICTKLDGVSAGVIVPSETVGGDGNPAAPDQCASIVTLRTPLSGRSHRGRIYVPGTPVNQVDADPSLWKSAWVSVLQGAVDAFNGDLDTDETTWGVLSRSLGAITPITSRVVRQYITTQRRRLTGGL